MPARGTVGVCQWAELYRNKSGYTSYALTIGMKQAMKSLTVSSKMLLTMKKDVCHLSKRLGFSYTSDLQTIRVDQTMKSLTGAQKIIPQTINEKNMSAT